MGRPHNASGFRIECLAVCPHKRGLRPTSFAAAYRSCAHPSALSGYVRQRCPRGPRVISHTLRTSFLNRGPFAPRSLLASSLIQPRRTFYTRGFVPCRYQQSTLRLLPAGAGVPGGLSSPPGRARSFNFSGALGVWVKGINVRGNSRESSGIHRYGIHCTSRCDRSSWLKNSSTPTDPSTEAVRSLAWPTIAP